MCVYIYIKTRHIYIHTYISANILSYILFKFPNSYTSFLASDFISLVTENIEGSGNYLSTTKYTSTSPYFHYSYFPLEQWGWGMQNSSYSQRIITPLVIVFPIYPLSAASIIAFLSVRSLLSAWKYDLYLCKKLANRKKDKNTLLISHNFQLPTYFFF